MSDGDGIFGVIGEELKKFGKSAVSQVGGNDDKKKPVGDSSVVGELGKLGGSLVGQVTGGVVGDDGSGDSLDVAGQVGGLGKSLLGQLGAGSGGDEAVSHSNKKIGVLDQIKGIGYSALGQVTGQEIDEMNSRDQAQSLAEEAQVKAKIQKIYGEYAATKKREEQMEQQQEQHVEQQQKEFVKEKKKEQMDVTVAQTKANAEVKNMGAE